MPVDCEKTEESKKMKERMDFCAFAFSWTTLVRD